MIMQNSRVNAQSFKTRILFLAVTHGLRFLSPKPFWSVVKKTWDGSDWGRLWFCTIQVYRVFMFCFELENNDEKKREFFFFLSFKIIK